MKRLHRSLDDDAAPCPFSLWLATLSEAFPSRFPSEILAEVARLPVGLLDEMLEAKTYRQVKEMVDAADTADKRKRLPQTDLFDLVQDIELELAEDDDDG